MEGICLEQEVAENLLGAAPKVSPPFQGGDRLFPQEIIRGG
jgi:hypothetical protein